MDIEEINRRLAWVRPIAGFMRSQGIPDPVVQSAMSALLAELDAYLDTENPQPAPAKPKLTLVKA